jgi:hypothetical protein
MRHSVLLRDPCREAFCTAGYSPVLAFNVDDLQATLVRCLEQGAAMDGSIQHSTHGKASVSARQCSWLALGCALVKGVHQWLPFSFGPRLSFSVVWKPF